MSAYCFSPRIYHPRNPRATSLYQIVSNNHQEFLNVYHDRFENRYGYLRPEVKQTLTEYLRCGILSYGFARIKCQSCQHEYLLPFSCKERYLCPACHQRRVLEFSKSLTEHILVEDVAHRQIVFSIPKMFRIYFLYNRDLLPKLAHCGWEAVKEVLQTTLGRDDVIPGMVMDPAPLQRCGVHIQTYGRWANWNPHLHGIASDGCFDKKGNFYPLPKISNLTLEKVFTANVLTMLIEEKLITNDMASKILSWKHTGFSAHTKVHIDSDDKEGLQGLAQYIIRCPISEDKIILAPDKHTVIYKSALKPGIKKNFEVYNVLEFLAALTSHIPKAGRKMTIYYGWYSQASRGKRKRNGTHYSKCITKQVEDDNRTLRYRWSTLIKKVYADPLICPNCGNRMKIIAFIKKKTVIESILKHLGLLDELPHAHSPPSTEPSECDITYEPVFDDLTLPEQIELSQDKR